MLKTGTLFAASSFVVCAALLYVQGRQCVDRYLDRGTTTSVSAVSSADAAFPAFTVCPFRHEAYRREVLSGVNLTASEYKKLEFANPLPGGPRQFHGRVSKSLEDLLDFVVVDTFDADIYDVRVYANGSSDSGGDGPWIEIPTLTYGFCYSLELPVDLVDKVIRKVAIKSKDNVFIFNHHPGQAYSLESSHFLPLEVGKLILVNDRFEITHLLENQKENLNRLACSKAMDRGFDDCIKTRVQQKLCSQLGCRSPYLPEGEGGTFCEEDCAVDAFNESQRRSFYHLHEGLVRFSQEELCPTPCASIMDNKGFPTYLEHQERDRGTVIIYYSKNVKVTRVVPAYGLVSMLAEIGGYSGMLLGVSAFQLSLLVGKALEKKDGMRRVEGRKIGAPRKKDCIM